MCRKGPGRSADRRAQGIRYDLHWGDRKISERTVSISPEKAYCRANNPSRTTGVFCVERDGKQKRSRFVGAGDLRIKSTCGAQHDGFSATARDGLKIKIFAETRIPLAIFAELRYNEDKHHQRRVTYGSEEIKNYCREMSCIPADHYVLVRESCLFRVRDSDQNGQSLRGGS